MYNQIGLGLQHLLLNSTKLISRNTAISVQCLPTRSQHYRISTRTGLRNAWRRSGRISIEACILLVDRLVPAESSSAPIDQVRQWESAHRLRRQMRLFFSAYRKEFKAQPTAFGRRVTLTARRKFWIGLNCFGIGYLLFRATSSMTNRRVDETPKQNGHQQDRG